MSLKSFLLSAALYLIIIFSVLQSALIVSILAVGAFSLKYSSFALIPLAIIIDAYFGAFHQFPVLSVLAVVWCGSIELIKPRLFIVQS